MKLSLLDISIRPCLLALVLILPAPAAHAAPLSFFANLSGANEGMTVVFAVGLAVGVAVGYAVRAAISLRHRRAAMKRRFSIAVGAELPSRHDRRVVPFSGGERRKKTA